MCRFKFLLAPAVGRQPRLLAGAWCQRSKVEVTKSGDFIEGVMRAQLKLPGRFSKTPARLVRCFLTS